MGKEKILLTILLIALLTGGVGCKTTMVGEDLKTEAIYSMGTLEATMPYNIDAVFSAAKQTMGDLELSTSIATKDALAGKIVARDSADKKIAIDIKTVSKDSTNVKIHVGIIGDETKSKMIYNKIKENLM